MFCDGCKAKIWKIQRCEERYADVQVSTSSKNKQSGEWETDFSGFCRILGKDMTDKIRGTAIPKGGLKVELNRVAVKQNYNKEKKQAFTEFIIWDFEFADAPKEPIVNDDGFMDIPDGVEEDMPFT